MIVERHYLSQNMAAFFRYPVELYTASDDIRRFIRKSRDIMAFIEAGDGRILTHFQSTFIQRFCYALINHMQILDISYIYIITSSLEFIANQ